MAAPSRPRGGPLVPAAALGDALRPLITGRRRVDLGHAPPRAAVLILLYDRAGEPHLVLTKRTRTVAHHRGEVSLPGGRWEPRDVDLAATALRETEEEIGVPTGDVATVGALDDVRSPASGFTVSPFVGVLTRPVVLVPSAEEIDRVLEVPLAAVLALDRRIPALPDRRTLRYPLLGEDVWGLTARILHGFAALARDAIGGDGAGASGA